MSLKIKQVEKFYGDTGIWFCNEEGCDYVFMPPDLKKWDNLGHISWGILASTAKMAMPLCPGHGILLEYDAVIGENDEEWKLIQEVAAISGRDPIPYRPDGLTSAEDEIKYIL